MLLKVLLNGFDRQRGQTRGVPGLNGVSRLFCQIKYMLYNCRSNRHPRGQYTQLIYKSIYPSSLPEDNAVYQSSPSIHHGLLFS